MIWIFSMVFISTCIFCWHSFFSIHKTFFCESPFCRRLIFIFLIILFSSNIYAYKVFSFFSSFSVLFITKFNTSTSRLRGKSFPIFSLVENCMSYECAQKVWCRRAKVTLSSTPNCSSKNNLSSRRQATIFQIAV